MVHYSLVERLIKDVRNPEHMHQFIQLLRSLLQDIMHSGFVSFRHHLHVRDYHLSQLSPLYCFVSFWFLRLLAFVAGVNDLRPSDSLLK